MMFLGLMTWLPNLFWCVLMSTPVLSLLSIWLNLNNVANCTYPNWEKIVLILYDILCDLVPFVQVKKRENHTWRSVTLVKLQAKVILLYGCSSRFLFLNYTNGTTSRKTSYISEDPMWKRHSTVSGNASLKNQVTYCN